MTAVQECLGVRALADVLTAAQGMYGVHMQTDVQRTLGVYVFVGEQRTVGVQATGGL
jgi:hypothetical protein